MITLEELRKKIPFFKISQHREPLPWSAEQDAFAGETKNVFGLVITSQPGPWKSTGGCIKSHMINFKYTGYTLFGEIEQKSGYLTFESDNHPQIAYEGGRANRIIFYMDGVNPRSRTAGYDCSVHFVNALIQAWKSLAKSGEYNAK